MSVSGGTWPDHLLTLDEWGSLPEDTSRRYELVEGVLVVAPRPASRHQRAIWRLTSQLEPQLPTVWGAITEAEVVISAGRPPTVRVPDVLVVPAAAIDEDRPRWAANEVRLAVEIISPGSARTDRVMKLSEYAEVGIAHYWIIDLAKPVTLTRFRLVGRRYELLGEDVGKATVDLDEMSVALDLDALTTSRS